MIMAACWMMSASAQTYHLAQILDSARHNNSAMRQANYDIEAAMQKRKEAFTKFFPNISATGLWFNANKGMAETTINPSEIIPASLIPTLMASLPPEALLALSDPVNVSMMKNGTIGSLMAVQPVFAGGQIINGNKLAKVGEEVSQLKYQLSENEIEKTAQQYFWQIISLQEKLKTIAAVDTLLKELQKDVDMAVKAGVTLSNDLLQVQLRQNDLESQKLKLNNGLAVLKMILAQYCGLKDTSFSLVEDHAEVQIPMKHDHQQALLGTTEYQLLGKQVEAAKLQKKMAIGKNLPSVAVGAGYNYHNLLEKDHSFGMVFATVSIPISDWWGGSHDIKHKKIEYMKVVDEQQDKAELLQIRMQKAYNDVTEAYQQMTIAQRSIDQAKENLRLNRNFYKAGTTKMSDLLEAQMLYQQKCDQYTDAYADYQNKLVEYNQATGN